MSQTTTDHSASPRPAWRRWPLLAGVTAAVIVVFALAHTVLSPAPAPPPGATGRSSTGGQATSFTAVTLSGQQVTVPGGKPSVVFFFSANCGTCGPGAQALAQAQQATPGANYVAVDVDPSETDADVAEFLATNQATSLAYTLDTDGVLTRAYQLTQLSNAVVLDADGTIVYRGVDPTAEQIRTALATAGAR